MATCCVIARSAQPCPSTEDCGPPVRGRAVERPAAWPRDNWSDPLAWAEDAPLLLLDCLFIACAPAGRFSTSGSRMPGRRWPRLPPPHGRCGAASFDGSRETKGVRGGSWRAAEAKWQEAQDGQPAHREPVLCARHGRYRRGASPTQAVAQWANDLPRTAQAGRWFSSRPVRARISLFAQSIRLHCRGEDEPS